MDVYLVNHDFWPLKNMERIFHIEFPLIYGKKRKTLMIEISEIVKKLDYINNILKDNMLLIEYIDNWIKKNEENSSCQEVRFIETINSPQ